MKIEIETQKGIKKLKDGIILDHYKGLYKVHGKTKGYVARKEAIGAIIDSLIDLSGIMTGSLPVVCWLNDIPYDDDSSECYWAPTLSEIEAKAKKILSVSEKYGACTTKFIKLKKG